MSSDNVISLRRFRAHKHYRHFVSLPSGLRTPERSEPVLQAIFDYAYEHFDYRVGNPLHNASWEETRQVSQKLVEFMPITGESDPDSMMQWLHENMVPEAWMSPEYLRDFIHECLRQG